MLQERINDAIRVCPVADLVAGSGVAALLQGCQIALFYLPDEAEQIFAVSNYDPIGRANVLSRGIVGDCGGRLAVASPLYKQHFDLRSGQCLEQPDLHIPVYTAWLDNGWVLLAAEGSN